MKNKIAGILLVLILVAFLFRNEILIGFGSFLIYENELKPVTYAFVLSGGPWDRGNEAAKVYKKGFIDTIVCTGENIPADFKALGLDLLESEITQKNILKNGVPDSKIKLIKKGTSTQEEADAILQFCKQQKVKQAIVLSSKFHTRRIKQVFKKRFEKEGINIIVHGAPSSQYNEMAWWQNEYGLIALNNEYIKQVYYLLKH